VRDVDGLPIDEELWVKLIIIGPSGGTATKRWQVIDGNGNGVSQQSTHTRSVVLHAIVKGLDVGSRRSEREQPRYIAIRSALFRAGALFRNCVREGIEDVEVMAGLGTACGEEAKHPFGTFKSAFSREVDAGLSEVFDTKHKACSEDECSVTPSVWLRDDVARSLTS
jgi:hypothetical protein